MKRTIVRLNVEHQLVSPADLNLVGQMEHWLWIILAALFFGKIESSTCFLFKHLNTLLSSTWRALMFILQKIRADHFCCHLLPCRNTWYGSKWQWSEKMTSILHGIEVFKAADCSPLINHLYWFISSSACSVLPQSVKETQWRRQKDMLLLLKENLWLWDVFLKPVTHFHIFSGTSKRKADFQPTCWSVTQELWRTIQSSA